MDRASVEAWITEPRAEELFRAAGMDYATLKKQAANRDFHPIDMGMRASIEIHNTMRTIQSRNVVAKRTGSDPALKSQFVIYTAHWDHLGIGPRINGDSIYHGALDNASGVAALLEIARAYSVLKTPPKRTILFISVTAEEQGLLGSEYYATHPLYPRWRKTAAEINMDGMDVWGKTSDITGIGRGESNLDDVVAAVAREQGRTVEPDPEPEKGLYLPLGPFQFCEGWRAGIRSRRGDSLRREARRLRTQSAPGFHRARLSRAQRRDQVELGYERRGAGLPVVLSSRRPRGECRKDAAVEQGFRVSSDTREEVTPRISQPRCLRC